MNYAAAGAGVPAMNRKIGGHAVVLGASMAGLLAAQVLADAYRRAQVGLVSLCVSRPLLEG